MFDRRFLLAAVMLASVAAAAPALSSTLLEHEIVFGPDRVRIDHVDGHTVLATPGAMREWRAGRPDVPWFGERVDLPFGTRISRVEVLSIETQPVADGVRIPSAALPKAQSLEVTRSAPDPAYFASAADQPENPVQLGVQGYQRGQNEGWLQVSPVRWSPRTGHLERVTRVRVRLTLEDDAHPSVAPRERIVREWEDAPAAGMDARTFTRSLTTATPLVKGRAQPFQATQVPSLLGSPVQYLIVTNQAMSSQFQRLADWKTQSGVPAVVRTIEFIRQQYPGGADDAERIRNFIRDAYTRWGVKWVLLGGDTDVLPTRYGYSQFYLPTYIATDLYYSCLDGNWNANGDSIYGESYVSTDDPGDNCDLMPDVYVGRAPTTTVNEAQQFVDKVFQYSRTPVGDYENSMILFAQVLFPQDWEPGQYIILDGAELVEELLPTLNAHSQLHYVKMYQNYTDTTWTPGALPLIKQTLIDSLNHGYNIAVHVGHGFRNTMALGGGQSFDNGTASSLTNGNRLMNLYAINCTSNAIDFPSIGEAFLHASNGGAVSNIGSTNFDFPTAGRVYQDEYFKLLFDDSITSIGQAQAMQKLPYVPFSVYDGANRWTQMTLLLLGDPEMHVWTDRPRTFAVTIPPTMVLSDSQIAVHVQIGAIAFAGARVTAYKVNEDFASLTTDPSGNVTLPFRPDSLGPITLTVTGFNCRPFQGTINVVATGLPLLADTGFSIDDDNVGGTSGNGDGLMDAGEVVDLKVPIRNNGGSTAPAASANLTTTDGMVSILSPSVNYGAISSGQLVNPTTGFRISTPFSANDQREIPFQLTIFDGAGHSRVEKLQVVLHAPEVAHNGHSIVDTGGNSDGVPDPGETVSYTLKLRNNGTGKASGITVKMRNYDGQATVTDSTSTFGDIAAGAEATGDPLVFHPSTTTAKLEIRISDQFGLLSTQLLDLVPPAAPQDLQGTGSATSIQLQWARGLDPDLRGYNVYRATNSLGPYVKSNLVPTDRTSYYLDEGLTPLTAFFYKVTAVDSSGNESAPSFFASASTNPPTHTIFPIQLGGTTPSSVAIDHVYSGYPMDIFAGADVLYAFHPDGTSPLDADGQGTTAGDFTKFGQYYAAGPSIADLDGDGIPEIIAPTWNDSSVYVYTPSGAFKSGWPLHTHDAIWSSAAIGDLDKDGKMELAFASNGSNFYVMKADGSEWMDGDNNPSTKGVFKVLSSPPNYGTPALADIDGDGYLDIIYGGFDGYVYVWNRFGNNLPGFPVYIGGNITASVAVGPLDGPGTAPQIVVPSTNNGLYVIQPDGTFRPGFPTYLETVGTTKTPSPALADMNNDGKLDIVVASTNGAMYVYGGNGFGIPPWNGKRYSSLPHNASESSPVVADINGDGKPDIVMGGEDGHLAALSNDGTMLPGFPIVLGGEVRGTPAVCDCDGDGMTEIVLAGWDKLLHVWDYNFPFSPGHTPPWPQFHHDARRTGSATSPAFVDVSGPPAVNLPTVVELSLPAPNPSHSGSRIDYAVPKSVEGQSLDLAVFDLTGRKVKTLASGAAHAGRYSASWDLRGDGGETARTGVYFVRFRVGPTQRAQKLVVVN